MTQARSSLTLSTDPDLFKSSYWLKTELVAFARENSIPSSGSKVELTERIEKFLRSETVETPSKVTRTGDWDSKKTITCATPVINYKNDAKTKKFFESQIGAHFHFNDYLRQFAKVVNSGDLTYGDLVKGWQEAEANKQKKTIAPQFQYNQFQRDFYANEKGKSREDLKAAWELVKSVPGPTTYAHYVQIRDGQK